MRRNYNVLFGMSEKMETLRRTRLRREGLDVPFVSCAKKRKGLRGARETIIYSGGRLRLSDEIRKETLTTTNEGGQMLGIRGLRTAVEGSAQEVCGRGLCPWAQT